MNDEKELTRPPISSGWRGHLNGHIKGTGSSVKVATIDLTLDHDTAYALCNLLHDDALEQSASCLATDQKATLSNLGACLGRLIDHGAANNGGRNIVKP